MEDNKKHQKEINLVGKRLWVTNLDYRLTWQELKDYFKTGGEVVFANILMDRNYRSTGSGIVEFKTREDALNSYKKLNYTKIGDSKFFIFIREDREDFAVKPKTTFQPTTRGNSNSKSFNPKNNYPPRTTRNRSRNRNPRPSNPKTTTEETPSTTPPDEKNKRQIFLGNLPYTITYEDLKDIFSSVGEIEKTEVHLNYAGRSRGNGIVLFKNEKDAVTAVEKYNGMDLNGREILVKFDDYAK